jgi:mono/diheme cytochrome c family protein
MFDRLLEPATVALVLRKYMDREALMKTGYGFAAGLAAALALIVLVALSGGAGVATAEDEMPGKALFVETHKCSMCHAVPAAGIEAKTKSESMKGSPLGGKIEGEFADVAAYVRKEAELDGKEHKKPFKGTDEELQAIIDWLGTLEPPAE